MWQLGWLMRAKRWAHNPPSPGRVKLVLGLIVLLGAIAAVEAWVGWPDWATVEPRGPGSGRF